MRAGLIAAGERKLDNYLIALAVSVFVLCWVCAVSPECVHWFVLPVLLAGVLSGSDAVAWVRHQIDIFDPVGIVGLAAFYSCFLAPLLHVATGRWMAYVIPPADWRPWLGLMGVLNCAGLLVYRLALARTKPAGPLRRVWRINYGRFAILVGIALAGSALLELYVYRSVGGLEGYARGYMQSYGSIDAMHNGQGWLLAISESFPILLMISAAVLMRYRRTQPSWAFILALLAVVFALQVLCGGFRGSRGNTVWTVIWAAGIVHIWIRRVPRILVWSGMGVFIGFMYLFGFYKDAGMDAVEALKGSEYREYLTDRTGRSMEGIFLGDLERSDVQAFLLSQLLSDNRDYDYAWGQTYAGTATLLVPKALWADRLPTKVKWTTETEYGTGSYPYRRSSRIYGLAGEAILNFGILAAPFSFALLGWTTGKVRALGHSLAPDDARMLFIPFLVLLCVLLLNFDSDNLLWFLAKHGGFPFLVLLLSCRQQRVVAVRVVPVLRALPERWSPVSRRVRWN